MKQDYIENLHLAFDTVRSHKLRSFLAILGVMIGVALIILVVGLVQGFRETIQDQISAEGINTAWVDRYSQGIHNGRIPRDERERKPLTLEDGQAIQQLCPDVQQTATSMFEWEIAHDVKYQN
ncbi:MAG: ABC transporter permease, partial [Candidatus Binataceae bacterium]